MFGGSAGLGAAPVGSNSYSWTPSTGLSDASVANPSVSLTPAGVTVYTLTTSLNGCSSNDLVNVTVNALPVLNAGTYGPVCADASIISLSGSPAGGTFSGSGVAGGSFDPSVSGIGSHVITYSYTDGNTCSNTVTTTILVNNLPDADAGNDSSLTCENPVATLNGSSSVQNAQYSWSSFDDGTFDGPSNVSTPFINGEGTFVLTVTDPSTGCSATDTALVARIPCIFPYYPPPPGGKVFDLIGAELNSLYHNFGSINTSANDIFVLQQDSVYIEVIAKDGFYPTLLAMLQSPAYGMVDLIDNGDTTLIVSGKFLYLIC